MYYGYFLFNHPAPTWRSTDSHTLSLHDALPIEHRGAGDGRRARSAGDTRRPAGARGGGRPPARPGRRGRTLDGLGHRARRLSFRTAVARRDQSPRSEEHTSELQSLMRISYAVFCLTKKNTPETPRQTAATSLSK